ncbi:MAG: ATPase, T2SS/T4P/T4SS family, partial [Planctomycetota bacterium]
THDAYTKNVQTVEVDPQAPLEGVRQVQFTREEDGAEYSTTFRSIVRRDPDVVGLAELPDADTAKEIAAAESDRVRIYASVRADSALAAVQLYVKAAGSSSAAAKGLGAVVAQKLARRLCENCRVPYQPPPAMMQKLGLPADKVKQLYKKGGQVLVRNKPETCPVCAGSGFDGQIGIFEVFPVGPEERQLIADQDWTGLRAAWRKHQLPSMQQAALRRAIEGVTSVEEVTRVTAPPKAKASGSPKKKAPPAKAS